MRILKVIPLLALLVVSAACGGDSEPTASDTPTATATDTGTAAAEIIGTDGLKWAPADVTIKAGESVTWKWNGSVPHNVAAEDKSFRSHEVASAPTTGEFVHSFPAAGSFKYLCEVHGSGMSGTVTVQ